MVKERSQFICQKCGYVSVREMGRCPSCGEWGSLVEEVKSQKLKVKSPEAGKLLKISEVKKRKLMRIETGLGEVDRVLGGGIVLGSVVLLAGEPGIGKSTLLSQLLTNLGGVYVSGEESPEQVKMRIERLRFDKRKKKKDFYILPETNIESIVAAIPLASASGRTGVNPKRGYQDNGLVVVDSIQTMTTEDLTGTAGSVGQVRESANKLLKMAKFNDLPLVLVGHVTKEGAIAGPKVLEHLVDTVLYLEGDRQQDIRLLRVVKNRFGPTDEVGVFKMTNEGMLEIADPSGVFLQERLKNVSGSVVVPTLEGNRVLLVEIQALVTAATLKYPRRLATGIERRRLEILSAVLQKHLRLPLERFDIYLNVTGGIEIVEPGVGLGVCLAIASSVRNKPLPERSAVVGEVGLLGEIRPVFQLEKRIKEARKMGFRNLITPERYRGIGEVVGRWLK